MTDTTDNDAGIPQMCDLIRALRDERDNLRHAAAQDRAAQVADQL